MPENKFEKNVQQQMEELRLRPSDAVWANVEKELKEKKKRRVIFFLFMLAGLSLLGYSVYTFTGNRSNSLAVTQTKKSPSITEQSTTTNNNIVKREIIVPVATNKADQTKVQQPVQSNRQSSNQTQTLSHTQAVNQSDRLIKSGSANDKVVLYDTTSLSGVPDGGIDITAARVVKKKTIAKNHKTADPDKNTFSKSSQQKQPDASIQPRVITETVTPVTENNVSSTVPANNPLAESHDLAAEVNKNKLSVSDDSLIQRLVAQDSAAIATAMVASGIEPEKQIKKKIYPKLKWGSDISVGTSFSRNTIFPFSSSQEKALRDAIQAGVNSPGSTGNSLQLPSAVQPGIGFKAGVAVQLQLSKRSSLVSGLRYTYLNERIKVGALRRDTLVYSANAFGLATATSVYRGMATQQYTNKYHFVELPLLYQLQVNKGKKLPMLWSVGLTTSYLISTNALVYDTAANGIYYKNKQAFNKLHVGLQTGLLFRFGNEKKIQWQVGPELSLDLSQQLKQNIFTDKRYLFYGGITGKMFFGRKKK